MKTKTGEVKAMRHEGWIFDVYPVPDGMRVWAILENGHRAFFDDPWRASFVVDGADWPRARALLASGRGSWDAVAREGMDLYSQRYRPVMEVSVPPLDHLGWVRRMKQLGTTLFNADLPPAQRYFYEKGYFPLAHGFFTADKNRLVRFEIQDDPWRTDFSVPPLRVVHLALSGSEFAGVVNPNHGPRGGLVLTHEETTHILEGDPADQMDTLDRRIQQWDPDVLTTDWGDSYLIPRLLEWAQRLKRPLRLNRDPDHPTVVAQRGRSYMTYGKMIYQADSRYLFGRWHLDLKNSFYFKECGWEGLYEIARIAKIPVQRAARTTIGTSLSSMQLDVALRRGLLIPMDKAQVEDFRPASDLVVADKGGLVYEPDVGWFENIAEYDFVSMYPTLMVKHNISPETMNCSCCGASEGNEKQLCSPAPLTEKTFPGGMVPEIGHHLCQRRQGLVPEVLAPLLKKRAEYKRLSKSGHPDGPRFKARADAHKWCLVTCVDGKTRLLYREHDEIKTGSIRDLIDRHSRGGKGVIPLNHPVEVIGLDEKGRVSFRPVKMFVRQPAPPALLRVRVAGGRKINYTADHDCLILKNGRLMKRKAGRLRVGDWLPVLSRLPSPKNPPGHVDVFRVLLEGLPAKELPLWRVFGNRLGQTISDNAGAIEKKIKGDYPPLSLRNWRSQNYLPFHLVNFLPKGSWTATHVGRGKRSGGLVQKIPARLELSEGLGFFLGFYVGDGSVSGRMIRLDVGTAEKDIADFLAGFVRDPFCLKVHRYQEKGTSMEVLQINSIALIRILEVVFGLGRASDSGKLVVPPLVLNGPREFRRGFLRGLLATDGHVSKRRNFVGWSSISADLVEDLGVLLGMEGLQFRFSGSIPSLSRVDVRGATDVRELMLGGILSKKHAATMRGQPKRTAERRPEFPPQASGLLRLAQKARVARVAPRLTGIERISLPSARLKIEQIRQRLARLSPRDVVQWARVAKLLNGDVVYERVKSIQEVSSSGPYVYCVTLNQEPRAFCLQGGVLTGNCFGYLGYKNARFGKIEAHESVTAWGREVLLRAKECVERRGFHVLHANVDCVWIQAKSDTDFESVRRAIEKTAGAPVGLEGVYKWLRFCPSKTDPLSGVPNRYFGAFTNGELKVRGLALRRRDTPEIFKKMQKEMLAVLAEADDVAGCRARWPRVAAIAEAVRERIVRGHATPAELAITFCLSRAPSEYVGHGPSAVAARRLAASGVDLHAGESVRYIITSAGDKVADQRVTPLAFVDEAADWDTKKYLELWQRVRDEILDGLNPG